MTITYPFKYEVVIERWSKKNRPLTTLTVLRTNDRSEADAELEKRRATARPRRKNCAHSVVRIMERETKTS